MQTFREGRRFVRRRVHAPDAVATVEWLQHAKTALAGTLAWVVATEVLGLDQPFLAPWAAVLVVHATVYRTVSRGGQQIVATFLGVILAWAAGSLFGLGALGMAVMLGCAFLVGKNRWLVEEATTVATTGIVVLATNAIDSSHLLFGRLTDTAVGIVVGLAVNLVVWPPLRDRAAREYARALPGEMAGVLEEMSSGLTSELTADDAEEWVRRCRTIDVHIDHAWGLLRLGQESSRFNPRRSKPADLDEMVRMLHLLEEVVAESLSLTRTVATSAHHANLWDDSFRTGWQQLLAGTAAAMRASDTAALEDVRRGLDRLAQNATDDELARRHWHEYGGVLVNLRNIVDAAHELSVWTGAADRPSRRTRFDLPRPARMLDRERVARRLARHLREV